MKNFLLFLLLPSLISCQVGFDKENNPTHENQRKTLVLGQMEKLAGNFGFTEGPAVAANGAIYFTDIPNNLILKWTLENQLDTFRINSGGANGLFFDKDENLFACEGEKGQVSSTSPDGIYRVLASTFDGERFNQPNDLWPDGKGGVYFTDPKYAANDPYLPQNGMHVYYILPGNESVLRVCDDYLRPNGILGSLDGKTLYITDNKAGKTYSYGIKEDGSLTNKSLFVPYGCDGMTMDTAGNIYITTNGKNAIDIFSVSGELLESIEVPEKPSNLCFGGEERNELYITASSSLYRIKLKTTGLY
jgi:gluconolactonase